MTMIDMKNGLKGYVLYYRKHVHSELDVEFYDTIAGRHIEYFYRKQYGTPKTVNIGLSQMTRRLRHIPG